MSNSWGRRSSEAREHLVPDMKRLFDAVLKKRDCSLLSGLRGKEEQDNLFRLGRTKAKFPMSDHNCTLDDGVFDFTMSDAVDAMPYPVEWPDPDSDTIEEFCRKQIAIYEFALIVAETARELIASGILPQDFKLSWGGMFNSFFDGPHWSARA